MYGALPPLLLTSCNWKLFFGVWDAIDEAIAVDLRGLAPSFNWNCWKIAGIAGKLLELLELQEFTGTLDE